MKTIKIMNWTGEVIAKAIVNFGRWEIDRDEELFKVYNPNGDLEFAYHFSDEYSWRAE